MSAPTRSRRRAERERLTDLEVGASARDFPILEQKVHGKPLVYLDNAATTQKPQAVIDAERVTTRADYANVHRGVHD